MASRAMTDRNAFERLVATSAPPPASVEAIRAELERQIAYEPDPATDGLDQLAAALARRLVDQETGSAAQLTRLGDEFPRQPLIHLYGFALNREAANTDAARGCLDALLDLDPGDPMAHYFDAFLRAERVTSASENDRLANIAKFAATPLLKNPYSLAVGLLFDAIRDQEHARVLDIGVGGGAQMSALLDLLGRHEHRIRRIEIVGLDFNRDFLAKAGGRIAEAAGALSDAVDVRYEPVEGRIEALDDPAVRVITADGLDGANASIALHEVPGEGKLAALTNLRRIAPRRFVLAEWNYLLENTLAATSTEFVFNTRSVAAGMVAALREQHPVHVARGVVGDWLSQGPGQLTCPADQRQECFLPIAGWKALLEHSGFAVTPAETGDEWYYRTSDYGGATPIAVLVAAPA